MKKFTQVMLMAAVLGMPAVAQQLPNNGFEDGWGACTPWTSNNNTKTKGTTPGSWTISQVIGMSGTGATVVGEQVAGCESEKAVKVYNGNAAGQVVPGYVTLGTSWSTATGTGQNSDGGTFGGYAFGYKPDAVMFDYQRTIAGENVMATMVAYMWKGQTTQADVPGNIALLATSLKKVSMINRDRNILDIQTSKGGAVTKSEDFALIATAQLAIGNVTEDWAQMIVPFEYKTGDTPEMINLIFCSGDYFNEANRIQGNTLTVDNVKLAYYSRLESLNFRNEPVAGFASDVYEYDLGELNAAPSVLDFGFATMGRSSNAKLEFGENVVKVVVSNVDADVDGQTSHVYTLNYTVAEGDVLPEGPSYAGYLNGEMGDGPLFVNEAASIIITDPVDGKCDFALPDFKFQGVSMGDIIIKDVTVTEADGKTVYSGKRDGLKLGNEEAELEIVCNVTVSGTKEGNNLYFEIPVSWLMTEDDIVPINVLFTSNYQNVKTYGVYLNVQTEGEWDSTASEIEVIPMLNEDGEEIATFVFNLGAETRAASALNLGRLEIPGVEVTDDNGVATYSGNATGLTTGSGATVNATLAGTIQDENVNLTLNLTGDVDPMEVVVSNTAVSVKEIFVAGADAQYYDVNGCRVNASYRGVVIVKQGDKTYKVINK